MRPAKIDHMNHRHQTTCDYCQGPARARRVLRDWRPLEFVSCYECGSDYVRVPKEEAPSSDRKPRSRE